MKNISRFFVAALALVGVTSCNTAPVEEVNLSTTTITASFADSRTTLSDGVKTLWAEYDAIEVNGVTFTLSAGAGEATATFTSTTPLAAAESYTATYPAGVTSIAKSQIALAGTFDPEAALAVATGNDANNLVFEHRHALLKFELAAPAAKVAILDYEIAASNGNMEAQTVYYLAVEAGTYAGLTATVDGVAVKSTENSVEIANGKILNLGTLPNGTAVEQKGIRTAADLVAFAANPAGDEYKDENGVINILADIDMKDVEWTPITDFTGTLDGNNHTIDNLVVSNATHAAMFKNLSDATIQNLVMGEGCSFTVTDTTATDSYAGAIVGQILTGATIKNVKNYATISGAVSCGGICGAANLTKKAILFEDCANYGSVTFPAVAAPANLMVGGICGHNEKLVSYVNCTNEGAIKSCSTSGNKYNEVGGIVGCGSDQSMTNCSNSGTLTMDVRGANNLYFGGIVGRGYRYTASNCTNSGSLVVTNDTSCTSVYIGGLFGTLEGTLTVETTLYNCSNTTSFSVNCNNSKDVLAGGIVGYFRADACAVEQCTNSGNLDITSDVNNSCLGGIIGYTAINASSLTTPTKVYKCENKGTLTVHSQSKASAGKWAHVAGIVGKCSDDQLYIIDECVNRGDITNYSLATSSIGGMISECNCDVKNCTNYATLYVTDAHVGNTSDEDLSAIGGIVARLVNTKSVSGCTNYGTIIYNGKGLTTGKTDKGYVCQGGIVGTLKNGSVSSCANYGVVLGNEHESYLGAKGSIVGWGGKSAAVTISGCTVGGAIGSCVDTDEDMGVAKATAITAENYASYIYGGDAGNGVTVTDCVFGAAN